MIKPTRIDPARLRERMDLLGFGQSSLARKVGISQGTVAQLTQGRALGSKHLHTIARELQTTPQYLTGETDDPLAGALPVPTPELIAEQLGIAMIPELDLGFSMGGGSVMDGDHSYEQIGLVPMMKDWLRTRMKGGFDQLFIAHGDGDSMQPTLLNGDIVLIDRAQQRIDRQDHIWCLTYGHVSMIKRVRSMPDGGYQINSDNPAVTPVTAYDGEMHVVGRVIWIGRWT